MPQQLLWRLALGKLNTHPVQATPSQVLLADVLGITLEDSTTYKNTPLHYSDQTQKRDEPHIVVLAAGRSFAEIRPETPKRADLDAKMTTADIDLSKVDENIQPEHGRFYEKMKLSGPAN